MQIDFLSRETIMQYYFRDENVWNMGEADWRKYEEKLDFTAVENWDDLDVNSFMKNSNKF